MSEQIHLFVATCPVCGEQYKVACTENVYRHMEECRHEPCPQCKEIEEE